MNQPHAFVPTPPLTSPRQPQAFGDVEFGVAFVPALPGALLFDFACFEDALEVGGGAIFYGGAGGGSGGSQLVAAGAPLGGKHHVFGLVLEEGTVVGERFGGDEGLGGGHVGEKGLKASGTCR